MVLVPVTVLSTVWSVIEMSVCSSIRSSDCGTVLVTVWSLPSVSVCLSLVHAPACGTLADNSPFAVVSEICTENYLKCDL